MGKPEIDLTQQDPDELTREFRAAPPLPKGLIPVTHLHKGEVATTVTEPDFVRRNAAPSNALHTGFQKDDGAKAPLEMLPFDALVEVAKVMHFGAYLAPRPDGTKGYGRDNWRLCTDPARYEGAELRHFQKVQGGELHDKDSSLRHRAHKACNALFALAIELQEAAKACGK